MLLGSRPTNLLPWRQQRQQQKLRQLLLALMLTIGFAAVCLMLLRDHYVSGLAGYSSRQNLIQNELETLRSAERQLSAVQQEKQKLAAALARLASLQLEQGKALELLRLWQQATPAGVMLDKVEPLPASASSSGNIRIDGRARSVEQISLFMTNLARAGLFQSPQLLKVDRSAVKEMAGAKQALGDAAEQIATFSILLLPLASS